ncbi:hypothetical protein [Amycolatopsis sp.]|uniref:hypothetical protein n=1 Tax=Amycolatopsis sp. TaxID=37632 RepID=UPI002D80C682|nr:hypothetical protein [Amycolatopsis sp.]HET6707965.1 hypothetical protein [Amycolatopsis sp.]
MRSLRFVRRITQLTTNPPPTLPGHRRRRAGQTCPQCGNLVRREGDRDWCPVCEEYVDEMRG